MAIDRARAVGHRFEPGVYAWTDRDVLLYHLGIGAGSPPSGRELAYCYESDLQVLPTFTTLAPFDTLLQLGATPGLDFDPSMVLHGDQDMVVHRSVPVEGTATIDARVTNVWDKGRGAVVGLEANVLLSGGEPLATHRAHVLVPGEGGFGGPRGSRDAMEYPARDPDHIWWRATRVDQALLYRLSGDRNPLHVDPAVAAAFGFNRPILHGLCTYGIVCKAVVDELLDGDTAAVARYRTRFAGVVYPGETLRVEAWSHGDQILLRAFAEERDELILTNALVTCTLGST